MAIQALGLSSTRTAFGLWPTIFLGHWMFRDFFSTHRWDAPRSNSRPPRCLKQRNTSNPEQAGKGVVWGNFSLTEVLAGEFFLESPLLKHALKPPDAWGRRQGRPQVQSPRFRFESLQHVFPCLLLCCLSALPEFHLSTPDWPNPRPSRPLTSCFGEDTPMSSRALKSGNHGIAHSCHGISSTQSQHSHHTNGQWLFGRQSLGKLSLQDFRVECSCASIAGHGVWISVRALGFRLSTNPKPQTQIRLSIRNHEPTTAFHHHDAEGALQLLRPPRFVVASLCMLCCLRALYFAVDFRLASFGQCLGCIKGVSHRRWSANCSAIIVPSNQTTACGKTAEHRQLAR